MQTVRHRSQSGSALMLVPACVLILLLLMGLAIDSAGVYYEQRQLNDAASSLANQIASRAVDVDRFYATDGNEIVFDPVKVADLTAQAQAQFADGYLQGVTFDNPVVVGTQVTVNVHGTVRHIIMSQLPGGLSTSYVRANAKAQLLRHA